MYDAERRVGPVSAEPVAVWADSIERFNNDSTPCAAISHVFAYGGSIEYYADLSPPWQIYIPDANVRAAQLYARTAGVRSVTLVIDGHANGGDGGVDLAARTDEELRSWADALAARVCAIDVVVGGLQLDLEPLDWRNLPKFLVFLARLSASLRAPSCTSTAHPAGRAVSAFGAAGIATRSMWRALGPNGYFVVSGYDLVHADTTAGVASTPAQYAIALEAALDTIVREAGRADGRFMLGIPAAASKLEFARLRHADGTETVGSPQEDYVSEALRLIDAKGFDASPRFLGTALWGFAPQIEIPRGSGDLYFPSNPLSSDAMRAFLRSSGVRRCTGNASAP